jgi:hypothetical protein
VIAIVIEAQGPAKNVRVGAEFPPPEPVADHNLQVVAGSGIVRIEGATQLRVYTEHREVIRRNLLEAETQRLCTAGEVHVCSGAGNRRGLEYPGTLEVSPLRDRDADALRAYAGKVVHNAHQLGRVWIRQRVQQRGVDHAVDRGGGSSTLDCSELIALEIDSVCSRSSWCVALTVPSKEVLNSFSLDDTSSWSFSAEVATA